MATEAIDDRFGVPRHFKVGDGEPEDGAEKVQDSFVSLTHRCKMVKDRCRDYDMLSTLMIPSEFNGSAPEAEDRWTGQPICLLDHYGKVSLGVVKQWTADLMEMGTDEELENQQWILQLAKNSCTIELQRRIDIEFDKLDTKYQGGAVYLKLIFNFLVKMTDSVVTALQRYVKSFATKGLGRYSGENPGIAQTELVAICTRLDEVGKLLNDSVNDILDGLQKCSHDQFKKTFADIRSMKANELLGTKDIEGTTLEKIVKIFAKAVEDYNGYVLDESWHIPGAKPFYACWNCGHEGHRLPTCPKPRDEAEIAKNKKKFNNSRGRNNGRAAGGGGSSRGTTTSTNRNNYSRGKFGPPNAGEAIRKINNVWHCHCKKCDGHGWNKTHTTGYHASWSDNKSSFKLPATHPFSVEVAKSKGGSEKSSDGAVKSDENKSSPGEQKPSMNAAFQKISTKCKELETASEDPTQAAIAGFMRQLFESLNE
ncbi:hypothetical protein ACHAXS_002621 [Conticribra weissflogii]